MICGHFFSLEMSREALSSGIADSGFFEDQERFASILLINIHQLE